MPHRVADQVILITGASGGIGQALVPLLAEEGAKLVVASRRADALTTLVQNHPGAISIPTDVTQPAQVEALFAKTQAQLGRVDILINLAGVGILKQAHQLTPTDLDQMVDVNLKGGFYTTQAAATLMREQKSGHVLNFPGILGRHPMAMAAGYCASKFAIVGFTKCMADELKRFGVRFTLFYFGGIDSPFWDAISLKVQRDKMLSTQTAAEAILFALSQPPEAIPSEIVLQPESHQFL